MKKRLMKRLLVCLFGALLLVSSACIKTDDVTETASSGTAPGSTVTAEEDTDEGPEDPGTVPAVSRDLLTFTPASPSGQVLTEKGSSPQILITNYNETATDALGRTLPTSEEAGLPKEGKYVGLFYLIWTTGATCDVDNAKAIASNPSKPDFGPRWGFCWWSEPETGYHRADDVWQIKRDMYYFAMAGVDFLYIDFTNGYLYEDTFKIFLDTCLELRAEGQMTPYIVPWGFGTSVDGSGDIGKVYKLFMTDEKYADLWFYWEGKPLAMIKPTDDGKFPILDDEYYSDKLTFRKSWVSPDKYSEMYWEDNRIVNFGYGYGWVENEKTAECTGIGCAGFANFGSGRSGTRSAKTHLNAFLETETMGRGTVFENSFKQLMRKNPECQVLLISRWNEWVAQNFTLEHYTDTGFVDQFNPEFSRDIEPMKGGFTDNYFYQMCSIIRRFKGVLPADGASGRKTLKETDEDVFEKWENVYPVYTDFKGDTSHRDHSDTTGKIRYVNDTGRNDIVESRIASDGSYVYFYARTAENITPYETSPNRMLLFIDADNDKATGFEGYDYLINYEVISDSVTALCAYKDGVWQETGCVSYAVKNDRMTVTVPRSLIGLTGEDVKIGFHWIDNVTDIYSLESWFTTGDSAPERRNNYAADIAVAYTGKKETVLAARETGKITGMRALTLPEETLAEMKKGLLLSMYTLPPDYPAQPDFRLIDSLFAYRGETGGVTADALPANGNVGAVYEGYVNVKEDGKYDFRISYNCGAKLFIDGRLVADGSYDPSAKERKTAANGSLILEKGLHSVRVEYAECRGEKPAVSLEGDWDLCYSTYGIELREFPSWTVDFAKMKDQIAYSEEGAPAGIYDPYIYLKYGYTAYLGSADLSKYSRVEITYCCDGSDITRERFEASPSLAIGLKSADSSYGYDRTVDPDNDIAHTDMVFSNRSWATGARDAVVDLSAVDYSGDVWLAVHNPPGTFIAILEIRFYS
ncbi:MAG: hypothetical protein II777_08140 [Clostridia bacterium]|nr:hypothetical protein [Clostridia bacterium]